MTPPDVVDQYPSTSDLPRRIAGGQDAVLAILRGARRRFKGGGTSGSYIDGRWVCAVGAVAREAGVTGRQYHVGGVDMGDDFVGALKEADIEASIRQAAKQAIALLNASARRLFPEITKRRALSARSWSGPLEYINQELEPFSEAKKAVLACYDDAIERRQAEAVAS